MPEDSPPCFYRSIHGVFLCRDHALGLTIQQLADEEWARVPDSQTRGHLCQGCVPDAPLLHHDSNPGDETWVVWHPGSASPHLVRISRSDPMAHRVVVPDVAKRAATRKRAKKR